MTDPVIEQRLGYWRHQPAGIPAALELPTDRPRPPLPSVEGGTLRAHLPESSAEAIRSFARGEGTTLVATALAAYDLLLHRYSGQDRSSSARRRPRATART